MDTLGRWPPSKGVAHVINLSSSELVAKIFDSMTNGLVAVDTEHRVVAINRAAAGLLEIQPEQGIGYTLEELGAKPAGGPERVMLYQAMRTGEPQVNTSNVWHCKGRIIYVSSSASPIFDTQGAMIGAVTVFEDITEKQILNERLKHAERLALLGEFAAQLVHEIRNPLSTFCGAFDVLEQDLSDENGDARRVLQAARNQLVELNELLAQLLDLSRQNTPWVKETVDIGPLLQEVILLMKPKARRAGVQIHTEIPRHCLLTHGVASELRQVFFNLMLNSVEAMERGGQLRIIGKRQKDRVSVEICDTGAGIGTNDLGRISEPFFTTKPDGTGLGLTVVQGIIDDHQGVLTVSSSDEGTQVVVDLPSGEELERSQVTHDRVFEKDI